VTITFGAPATQFFVGATVTGEIDVQSVKNVIQVPSRAVTTGSDGQATVVVASDGTASGPRETRDVTTGLVSGGQTQIVSGLRAGEHVVISLPTFPGAAGRTGANGFAGFGGGEGGGAGFGGAGNGSRTGTGATP
jgi:multidrug efflux pump subunit AcrA (membrane-fusion protein)